MFLKLLLLFTVVPILELALLIRIGRAIHVGPTVALVILTGVVGAALARHQGLRVLARIHEHLARGTMPATEMVEGLMILLAAAVLITPGVITDCFGLVLLIPPARAFVRKAAIAYFKKRLVIVEPPPDAASPAGNDFIDVEARDATDATSEGPTNERR